MSLVPHIDGVRRIWMFPRNIRRIYPWKMAQILAMFLQHLRQDDWRGNQQLQDRFCKGLEDAGLKTRGTQYDPNSGGPRTYEAQLRCLGLIFRRENNGHFFTIAGEDLAKGEPPLPILSAMLLRHQYPSAYGAGQNVRINNRLRVKPFLFILQLLNYPEIDYLTNEEIAVPVVYGHNHACLEICKEKILQIRNGDSFRDVVDHPSTDLYMPRTSSSPINNILHIGNTCKNYMQACNLVYVDRVDGEERVYFSQEIRELFEGSLESVERFIPLNGEESFQRQYGSWNRQKDTRRLGELAEQVLTAEQSIILSKFYQYCGENVVSEMPEEFFRSLQNGFGFDGETAAETLAPYLPKSLDFFESTFLELSRGGSRKATRFEQAIKNLFEAKLHFNGRHTGPLRSPNGGGYADVFLVALDNRHCALVDGKASPHYSLSRPDYRAMRYDYIPNYLELAEGRDLQLEFSLYVAGGFSGDVQGRLNNLTRETGTPCSGITASKLLALAKSNPRPEEQLNVRRRLSESGIL